MENQNKATHLADAIKNSNVEANAKFKIVFYHSDGFGVKSHEQEWVANISELRETFVNEIFSHIEKWLSGDFIDDEIEIDEDDFIVIKKTSYGSLRIELTKRYRAGGYDDDPVYRYDDDIYEIEPYTNISR